MSRYGLWGGFTKVNAVVEALVQDRKDDPGHKSTVLSQFPAMLSIIMGVLTQLGIPHKAVGCSSKGGGGGKVPPSQRSEAAVRWLQTAPAVSGAVLLVPISVSNLGLDLGGCIRRVYLVEPSWNPVTDRLLVEQATAGRAVGRCVESHASVSQRMQGFSANHALQVTRFVLKGTIEEAVQRLQCVRRKTAAQHAGGLNSALANSVSAKDVTPTSEELARLLQPPAIQKNITRRALAPLTNSPHHSQLLARRAR